MLLSMLFNQHSGAIYLRSQSYLVVKISSDIVTERHFMRSVYDVLLLSTTWFDFTLRGQHGK